MICHHCRHDIPLIDNKVGFRDDCPQCGSDLHACRNCGFYDPIAYNECRETNADRVTDKEKANFCEYFQPKPPNKAPTGPSAADEAKRKLAELFRKK